MVPEIFNKNWRKTMFRGIESNSNTLRAVERISCYCIFVDFDSFKYDKFDIHFCRDKKHVNNRIGYE